MSNFAPYILNAMMTTTDKNNKERPLILICNDDGYQAKGINELVDMLRDMADLLVCAPDSGRSGYACAFSATDPLRLQLVSSEEGLQVWKCNGTPVDCVKLALDRLLQGRRPDLVLGGINHGDNASVNTHYSGTMGVVLEGCMKYLPSVAFSLCDFRPDADFSPLRPYVREICSRVLANGLPKGVCLNVNFPARESVECRVESVEFATAVDSEDRRAVANSPLSTLHSPLSTLNSKLYKGVRLCRMGAGSWTHEIETCHHPRGYDYHWMVGTYRNDEPEAEDTDRWALDHGYVAITPTRIDVTAYECFDALKDYCQ